MNSAVFIERNGVLNLVRVVNQHQINPLVVSEFLLNPDTYAPLRRLKEAGLFLFATTNQPGLSQGLQSRRELDQMHAMLRQELDLDGILVCPHNENDHCPCRKPKPGLFLEAAHQWRLNLDQSFVISDKWQDADAAFNVGCTSLLVASPWNGSGHHDYILPSLADIVERILHFHSSRVAYVRQRSRSKSLENKMIQPWNELAGECNPA